MTYNGRDTYLLTVELQYPAQVTLRRKGYNKCMAVVACSTLLYQRNENSKSDTCCPPVKNFSILNREKAK